MRVLISNRSIVPVCLVVLLIVATLSLCLGRYPVSLKDLSAFIFQTGTFDENLKIILLNIRIPRILGAIALGGSLALAGASYQGMFRNPMVSPDILGVSSGAGFGAALGILLAMPAVGIQLFSFMGGMSAVLIAMAVSRLIGNKHEPILILVLSGIIISSFFGAMLSLIKYVADPDNKLPAITYWLMGSLSGIQLNDIKTVFPILTLGIVPLLLISWRVNVLSFGEDEARSLGINTGRLRMLIIVCSSLISASMISICGIVGWVGLIIPHLARMIAGPDYRVLLPVSFLTGGIFMLVVDTISRSLTPIEIPIGILTSVLGAPFFIYFLKKSSHKNW
ncbi:FecCD family ABC transporter permease [Parabacteroides sp. FAFU027]|uniref:FecCD family ABC transporter permease n=1 Tax=Parabacteroides sp. FAFU027 TaxID=2922715 RepID=UPI001FAE868E|nr:iron ABC transporter permease [Parabacteroides sp. FAFU027]